MGLRRSGLEVSPPPENLGTRNVPPRAPPEEHSSSGDARGWSSASGYDTAIWDSANLAASVVCLSTPARELRAGLRTEDTRVRRPRDQDNERGDKALPLPHIAIDGPLEEGSPEPLYGNRRPEVLVLEAKVLPRSATEVLPRDATEVLPRDATIKTTVPPSCDEMTRDAALALTERKNPLRSEHQFSRKEPDHMERRAFPLRQHEPRDGQRRTALARRLTDQRLWGRMAARPYSTVFVPHRKKGKRAFDGTNGGLVKGSDLNTGCLWSQTSSQRPKKRLERLLRLEEEILREREEFQWTDAEIDWYIDQEESLPVRSDDDDNEDRMDVD
ncbi:hypothetical protein B0H14DRAFT_2627847 [Mycena olivaceomarginata]|nr:hypothetical protein B0H14DRAFT_2627847 [Mycena olivaceomarginata]